MQTIDDVVHKLESQYTELCYAESGPHDKVVRYIPREELIVYISEKTFAAMCRDGQFFRHVTMDGPEYELIHGIQFLLVKTRKHDIVQLCRRQT